jgi:hypothetical protein
MEAGTVPEKVTISHRGDRFEIGRGKRFYGVWVSGAPESDPIDRWPETREGWEQAWMRFVSMETPGTIAAVGQQRSRFRLPLPRVKFRKGGSPGVRGGAWVLAAAGLLGLGVLLGVIGLFPGYFGSQSLASQAYLFVPHLIYLLTWAVSAALIAGGLRGRSRPGGTRLGALLGTGLSAVTFGLFFADLGQAIAGGASLLGAGLVLSLLGWLGCAAGSVLALRLQPVGSLARARDFETGARYQQPAWPGGPAAGPWQAGQMWQGAPNGPAGARSRALTPVLILVAATLAGLGAAAAFAPPWDSFTLRTAAGATQTVTAGNAFANPAPVIAGDVIVMIALVAVVVVAALWRPVRLGAALLAGAIIPMAAQAISAVVQIAQKTSPLQFGIDPGQANQAGLTISNGLTAAFWIYLVFVLALIAICGWMLAPDRKAAPAAAAPSPVGTFS